MRTASGHETSCFTCGVPPLFFPARGLLNTRTQAMLKMIWHSGCCQPAGKKVGDFGDAFPQLRPSVWFQAQKCGPKFCDIWEGIVHSRSTQRVDTRCDFQRFRALSGTGTTSNFEDCLLAWLRQKKLLVALQTSAEQRRNLKGEKRGAPTSAN